MYDFKSIMVSHGFTVDCYDFESAIIGFTHDISFSLFDTTTIFDVDQSQIIRQWDNPKAFIRAELVTSGSIDDAVRFFHDRWLSELRYENPVREIIDVCRSPYSALIHVLTIGQYNAMTLQFNIAARDH